MYPALFVSCHDFVDEQKWRPMALCPWGGRPAGNFVACHGLGIQQSIEIERLYSGLVGKKWEKRKTSKSPWLINVNHAFSSFQILQLLCWEMNPQFSQPNTIWAPFDRWGVRVIRWRLLCWHCQQQDQSQRHCELFWCEILHTTAYKVLADPSLAKMFLVELRSDIANAPQASSSYTLFVLCARAEWTDSWARVTTGSWPVSSLQCHCPGLLSLRHFSEIGMYPDMAKRCQEFVATSCGNYS